jgi:hypothetical protein
MNAQQYSAETLEDQISRIQTQYYQQNGKSFFVQSKQKLDCAEIILQNIPLEELMSKMIRIEENRVFFNYVFFKTFAHPTVYETIVNAIFSNICDAVNKYGSFEIHINMQSFTATAAQRYKDIIKLFCFRCLHRDAAIAGYLKMMYVYNSPKMIETIAHIFSGFVDDQILSKISIQT